jgi:hypothetical protein
MHLRPRIKRLVHRTMCFSTTTTMHDLMLGLCINSYKLRRPISHESNTFGTPSNRHLATLRFDL